MHKLEPTIRSIVVEGPSDQSLWTWFALRAGLDAVVYPIDVFEINAEDVASLDLENNNRGRVIALARFVSLEVPDTEALACVIDKDLDGYLGTRGHEYRGLYRTDFTCMEMYAFNTRVIAKFQVLCAKRLNMKAEQVLAVLAGPLVDRFAVRLANAMTAAAIQSVDWLKMITYVDGGLLFDVQVFWLRSLQKSRKVPETDTFREAWDRARSSLHADPRQSAHGHDFLALFSWLLKSKRCGSLAEEELRRALYLTIDFPDLAETPLFAGVLKSLGGRREPL